VRSPLELRHRPKSRPASRLKPWLTISIQTLMAEKKKARCREEVAAGSISNSAREEVRLIQRRHRIWEE
jgi:hypothetical protein